MEIAWPLPRHLGVPVWHMHESAERLRRLGEAWQRIAIGSSGRYSTPGTAGWWQRMGQAMERRLREWQANYKAPWLTHAQPSHLSTLAAGIR